MAKNRVAPLKQLTIPKLELTAAVIGARLCDHITSSIYCKRVFLWSDSQIVLKWLCSPKSQKPFVGNRVKEIMTLTNSHEWRYCPTESNPADLLSRGISFGMFKDNTLWMNGPSWLLHEENFPVWEDPLATFVTSITDTCEAVAGTVSIEEHKANGLTSDNVADIFNVNRFSSYKRISHVTAYVLRFISNCRSAHKVLGMLNSLEIDSASRVLIALAQKKKYPDIIKYFEKNCSQTKPNLIRQLDLFMDDDRIIRCGGRIGNAALHERTKYPYLLPPKDKLTDLIISNAHVSSLHSGLESTVTFLRQSFWIPTIRQRVKTIIHKCITCRKVTGQPYRVPDAPPLPKDRLLEAPPFTVTGVDFTGCLNVRNKDGSIGKAYICLFTCANTRAVHLEVVPNLTTEAFILALRRFCSRKSTPKIMMSDNALTYVATAAILKEEVLNSIGITWKFIPQHAPWYGGWWERLIGVTKKCIKKVLGKALVSMDVLQTVITEVECVINDRPLTFVSSDPLDKDPLTPSQLLYGRRINSPVYPDNRQVNGEENLTHGSANKMSRIRSAIIEQFWSKWKHEYLTSLRERHRTSGKEGDTVNIGDVIQIHDEHSPRNKWSLGIIQDVITSGDGRVRAAVVRSSRGSTTRPISKLYPLEVTPNEDKER
ncbi:uncharacterized protein LOC128559227 [Mercenaria mercenaria]|uniref:uncharacterized protein LOC128559227 n=1 Tax=Mercenaria mercenaria TaxID=6596 RepID=UPI00234EBFCD|nr:uncharacterized protein LOC128559227 [Mercenaria mercenaria]